ncbi:hypothetical protein KC347_g13 [Hortaea werneckii]|nr:hypothetical protein KC347_g13 [Hortaea werneckii]
MSSSKFEQSTSYQDINGSTSYYQEKLRRNIAQLRCFYNLALCHGLDLVVPAFLPFQPDFPRQRYTGRLLPTWGRDFHTAALQCGKSLDCSKIGVFGKDLAGHEMTALNALCCDVTCHHGGLVKSTTAGWAEKRERPLLLQIRCPVFSKEWAGHRSARTPHPRLRPWYVVRVVHIALRQAIQLRRSKGLERLSAPIIRLEMVI